MINHFDEFDFCVDLLEQTKLLLESKENKKPKETAKEASSEIKNLFKHLLKYEYQPEKQGASWFDSIKKAHGNIIKYKLLDNENVIKLIDLDMCYQIARKEASDETGLSLYIFPDKRPIASKYSYYAEEYDTWDFVFITNKNCIKQFLIDKYNPSAPYNIDISYIKNW